MADPNRNLVMKDWADISEDELSNKMNDTSLPKEDTKDKEESTYIPKESIEATDRKSKVEVEGGLDPNDPLFSVTSFEQLKLSEPILKGVFAMGFKKPSKIQEKALPLILKGGNLIAQAQSGTGKTAAFSLGMLSKCDPTKKFPQAICISPTRELARQLSQVIAEIGKFTDIGVQLIIQEAEIPKQITSQIVVGTPGKVLESLKKLINPKNVKMLVVDEADEMIQEGSGLGTQSQNIKKQLPKNAQILFFSATYAPKVRAYAEKIVPQPCAQIRLKAKELSLEGIQQFKIDCKDEQDKFETLSDIYGFLTVGQSIIFVHTRKTAIDLTQRMQKQGHAVTVMHAKIPPNERDQVFQNYKDGKTKVLISTNVLARGIDILQVMLVINYDIPLDANNKPDPQTYLHRIGRSGRFGRKGIAINLTHNQTSRDNLKVISRTLQKDIQDFKKDDIEKLQPMVREIQSEVQKLAEQGNNLIDSDSEDEKKKKEEK